MGFVRGQDVRSKGEKVQAREEEMHKCYTARGWLWMISEEVEADRRSIERGD